jgi:Cu/Ag efflux pump CusA
MSTEAKPTYSPGLEGVIAGESAICWVDPNAGLLYRGYDVHDLAKGASFEEAVERGSLERLSPILMTALCAGLALVPLVLAGGEPGNEIQAPMGVVILGGLLSSTALNMIVVPVLYARFARHQLAAASPLVEAGPSGPVPAGSA